MSARLRQIIGALAIYVIALQGVLSGFAAPTAFVADSSATIICHSIGNDDGGSPSDSGQAAQCDHCVLCNATLADLPAHPAFGAAPAAFGERLASPPSTAALEQRRFNQAFARGPPSV